MTQPIIASRLDQDAYKLTMKAAVAKHYPREQVRYRFVNRGRTPFCSGFAEALREQVELMSSLKVTADEKAWLRSSVGSWVDDVFIDYFAQQQYDPRQVSIYQADDHLDIDIEGPWVSAIDWEVPIMAIVCELYYAMGNAIPVVGDLIQTPLNIQNRAREKASLLREAGVKFADFGTRRRHSFRTHELTVAALKEAGGENFVGTSNMLLAYRYNLKPIGTQAHEWISFHAAKYGFTMANSMAMGRWVDTYHGLLGIALTDTFTTEDFLRNFDAFYAKLYDGVRHDSGDPFAFGERIIEHYKSVGVDPTTKTIVFSDGLTSPEAIRIHRHFAGRIRTSFGIGTHFTNDVGLKPLNIVIKMTEAHIKGRWVNVVKLSDNRGKHTGDPSTIKRAVSELNLQV